MNETIQWRNARHEVPNAGTNVLVCSPNGISPVWLGFYDGAWHFVDLPVTQIAVTFWAPLPEGPIG